MIITSIMIHGDDELYIPHLHHLGLSAQHRHPLLIPHVGPFGWPQLIVESSSLFGTPRVASNLFIVLSNVPSPCLPFSCPIGRLRRFIYISEISRSTRNDQLETTTAKVKAYYERLSLHPHSRADSQLCAEDSPSCSAPNEFPSCFTYSSLWAESMRLWESSRHEVVYAS